jgi:hypothetical protein
MFALAPSSLVNGNRTEELHQALLGIAATVHGLDPRRLEAAEEPQALEQFVASVQGVLLEAIAAVEVLSESKDPALLASRPQLAGQNQLSTTLDLILTRAGSTRVEDLAFMAGMELLEGLTQLDALASKSSSRERLIGQCALCLGKIDKIVTALENGLAPKLGLEAQLSFVPQTLASLQVRSAYAKFHLALRVDETPAPAEVLERLRSAATVIAVLAGRDIFWDLRLDDRIALRGLQRRLLNFLCAAHGAETEGLRLWQDLVGFASLLHRVNQRSELIDHDRILLSSVLRKFRLSPPTLDRLDAAQLQRLAALFGRDKAIDRLIEAKETSISTWRGELKRLARELRPGQASAAQSEWSDDDEDNAFLPASMSSAGANDKELG